MPTTNPVPSQDPSDLLFNAGKLDEVVNGTANSFTDRLGVARRTVAGMNADFDAQLADAESDLNVYRADAAASAAEAFGYLNVIRTTSYGAYANDPATDPLGNPPTVGDEYFNTTANLLKRWNGTTWQASDINTANLAASSGSSLIGYDGGTVQDVLDGAKSLQDYAALRAYTGRAKRIYITGLLVMAKPVGIAGTFQYDPTDTTSADNGGTIIVGADGRRWKRDFSGHVMASWFGVGGLGSTNDQPALQAATTYCIANKKSLFVHNGLYLLANASLQITGPITTIGESEDGAIIRAAKADLSAPDGVSGYKDVIDIKNTVDNAVIKFKNITLDGGDTRIYKPYAGSSVAKCVNAWTTALTSKTIKKLSFDNCTIKNSTNEGASANNYIYYNSSSDYRKNVALAEYNFCTFSSISLGACNVNGAQKVFKCKFFDQAAIEHALHRFDGFLEVIESEFRNAAFPNFQTISVLNENDPLTDPASKKGTRLIIRGNTFYNSYNWINNYTGTKTWLQTIGFKQVEKVEIKDNLLVNSAFGSSSGGYIISDNSEADVVVINDNTLAIDDPFFNTLIKPASYGSEYVEIKNNKTIKFYVSVLPADIFPAVDRPAPKRFVTGGNYISIPVNKAFTASLADAFSVNLPVRRKFNIRVEIKVNTSALTEITITNQSSGNSTTIYSGTPAVGTTYATATYTTDNISTGQYISQFLIKSRSDVSNTFTLEMEEI